MEEKKKKTTKSSKTTTKKTTSVKKVTKKVTPKKEEVKKQPKKVIKKQVVKEEPVERIVEEKQPVKRENNNLIYAILCVVLFIGCLALLFINGTGKISIDGKGKNAVAAGDKGDLFYNYLSGSAPNGKAYKELFKLKGDDKKIKLSVKGTRDYIGGGTTGNTLLFYYFKNGSDTAYTYCIEPGTPSMADPSEGKKVSRTISAVGSYGYWTSLSSAKRDMISLAMLYGFPNINRDNTTNGKAEQYAATQIIIWEIQQGWRTNYDSVPSNKSLYNVWTNQSWATNVKKYYEAILKDMKANNYIKLPNFAENTRTLTFNESTGQYELTLTDKNSAIRASSWSCPDGLECFTNASGSTFKVTSKTQFSSKSMKFERGTSSKGLLIVGDKTYQKLVLGIPSLTKSTTVSFSTSAGKLVIKKTCRDCDRIANVEFEVSKNGTLYRTVLTGSDGTAVIDNIPTGTYTIKEVNIPDDYNSVASQTAYISNGSTTTKTFTNIKKTAPPPPETPKYKVILKKVDYYTGKHVSGAILVVKDEEGNVVGRWETSEGTSYSVEVEPGTYYLYEEKTPETYVSQTLDYKFEVTNESLTHTVKNYPTKTIISKKDATNGEELPGAKLTVLDANGNDISCKILKSDNTIQELDKCTWTSTNSPTNIVNLKRNTRYILREDQAPLGYSITEQGIFTVADSKSSVVTMKDKPTEVTISKRDLVTGEEIEGAYLQITDEEGNVIDEWTSEKDKSHTIKGKLLAGKTYTLKEITTPKGYSTAEVVTIQMDKDGYPNANPIIMEDAPVVPTPDTAAAVNTTVVIIGGILLVIGCAGIAIVIKKRGA